jgi:REP element-mobilizing transposase RayT
MQDVQTYLPLLERNSITRKVLDVEYSLNYERTFNGRVTSGKHNVHLVFEADTGKYREEVKYYNDSNDTNDYLLVVDIWNGTEQVSWVRSVSRKFGFRVLEHDMYEHSGSTTIKSRPSVQIPYFASLFYDTSFRPFEKTVLNQDVKFENLSEKTFSLDTLWNRFEFAKKDGALKRFSSFIKEEDGRKLVLEASELTDHVERSGVLIALQIVMHEYNEKGGVVYKGMVSVDPKTLRLLDSVDSSVFSATLPTGCFVRDQIRKRNYTVRTVDTLPNDVEAIKKTLDKMLEQAEAQKAALEKKK